MPRVSGLLGLLVVATPTLAWAQAYEGSACETTGTAELKGLKVGAKIGSLDQGITGAFTGWATSMLAAQGKAPPKKAKAADEDDLNDVQWKYDEWTCMYSPQRLIDGDPKTAWCEAAEGDGVGEVAVAAVDVKGKVMIWTGFGRSPALYAANNRPRKVRVTVLQSRRGGANQVGTVFAEVKALAQSETELKDVNDYQELKLPKVELDEKPLEEYMLAGTFVAIEILSVYPGKKYRDTCISEVGVKP